MLCLGFTESQLCHEALDATDGGNNLLLHFCSLVTLVSLIHRDAQVMLEIHFASSVNPASQRPLLDQKWNYFTWSDAGSPMITGM